MQLLWKSVMSKKHKFQKVWPGNHLQEISCSNSSVFGKRAYARKSTFSAGSGIAMGTGVENTETLSAARKAWCTWQIPKVFFVRKGCCVFNVGENDLENSWLCWVRFIDFLELKFWKFLVATLKRQTCVYLYPIYHWPNDIYTVLSHAYVPFFIFRLDSSPFPIHLRIALM